MSIESTTLHGLVIGALDNALENGDGPFVLEQPLAEVALDLFDADAAIGEALAGQETDTDVIVSTLSPFITECRERHGYHE